MEIFIAWAVFIHLELIMYLKHEVLCNNQDCCHVEMPNNDNNTLKYNHGEKLLKAPWEIYVGFECLPIKQQSCQNNSNDSYAVRKTIHEPCGY